MKSKILITAIMLSAIGSAFAVSNDRMHMDDPIRPESMRPMMGTGTRPMMEDGDMRNNNLGNNVRPKRMMEMMCPPMPMPPMMMGTGSPMMDDHMSMMTSTSTIPNLGMGDGNKNGKGMHVRNLQAQLIAGGYMTGTTTGNFGAMTRDAVKKMQKEMGVGNATGYYGPMTKEKIKAKCPMPMDERDHMNGDRPMTASGTMPMMGR